MGTDDLEDGKSSYSCISFRTMATQKYVLQFPQLLRYAVLNAMNADDYKLDDASVFDG